MKTFLVTPEYKSTGTKISVDIQGNPPESIARIMKTYHGKPSDWGSLIGIEQEIDLYCDFRPAAKGLFTLEGAMMSNLDADSNKWTITFTF